MRVLGWVVVTTNPSAIAHQWMYPTEGEARDAAAREREARRVVPLTNDGGELGVARVVLSD